MRIEICNLQSIDHMLFEVDTGITQFVGDNSSCKSTITKVLEDLFEGRYATAEGRLARIKRGHSVGWMIIQYAERFLRVQISSEANDSYLQIKMSREANQATFYFTRDRDGIQQALTQFGFIRFEDVSLNVAHKERAIPFRTTTERQNFIIYNSYVKDNVAEAFLQNLKVDTLPAMRLAMEHDRNMCESYGAKLSQRINIKRLSEAENLLHSVEYLIKVKSMNTLDCYKPMCVPVFKEMAKLQKRPVLLPVFVPFTKLARRPIQFLPFKSLATDPLNELLQLSKNRCPYCGQEVH